MERRAKSILTGVAVFVVGGVLVTLGVAVWMDGGIGFGGGLAAAGILLVVAWFSTAMEKRKKSRKAQPENHPKG
jgi:hypothetical protein